MQLAEARSIREDDLKKLAGEFDAIEEIKESSFKKVFTQYATGAKDLYSTLKLTADAALIACQAIDTVADTTNYQTRTDSGALSTSEFKVLKQIIDASHRKACPS